MPLPPYYLSNINPLGDAAAPAAQLALYPQQTGTIQPGAAGMTWREWEITKIGDMVKWYVDDVFMGQVDTAQFVGPMPTGGNILFGRSDINYGSSTDPKRRRPVVHAGRQRAGRGDPRTGNA